MSEQFCPNCDKRCPVSALSCGRGRRYFGMAAEERGGHPQREPETGAIGMLRQCGHILHHGQPEDVDLLSALSVGERAELERLLGKLLADWQSVLPTQPGGHHRH